MIGHQAPNRQDTIGRRLRDRLEAAAGMHEPPATGTRWLLFGHCAGCTPQTPSARHAHCPETVTMGARTLRCSCAHHQPDPADFDAAYGSPWWAEQAEAE